MIKTIFWDFDGVIHDSMKIKGDGFLELFKNHRKKDTEAILKFHFKNGGMPRFDKIKYFYNQILKEDISKKEIDNLANIFSEIIKDKIFDKNNLIQDSLSFIKKKYKKYNFHIVSGSEDKELKKLCKYFNISKYFISINGSPTKKDILIKKLISKYHYKKYEILFIGDAMTDYNAAKKNRIVFFGYNNIELKKFHNYIKTFEELKLWDQKN